MNDYPMRTVANATWQGDAVVAIRARRNSIDGWLAVWDDGSSSFIWADAEQPLQDIRPLVVLDRNDLGGFAYENWGEVADSIRDYAHRACLSMGLVCELLPIADAIEAQTQPPKPEEPKEFGAKVTACKVGQTSRRRLIRIGEREPWRDRNESAFRWDELSDVTLGWDEGVSS